MKPRALQTVPVYLYKATRSVPDFLPKWGTLDAIEQLDGCIAITRSGRAVDASLLDPDGFLPYGISPDDLAA